MAKNWSVRGSASRSRRGDSDNIDYKFPNWASSLDENKVQEDLVYTKNVGSLSDTLPVEIINWRLFEGNKTLVLEVDKDAPFGFGQEVYTFNERLDVSDDDPSNGTNVNIPLQNGSSTKIATIIIEDDELPIKDSELPVDGDRRDDRKSYIIKEKGNDGWFSGTKFTDAIYGTAADDRLNGFGGRDSLYGRGGKDILYGGDDEKNEADVNGGADDVNADYLNGGTGDDHLYGQAGEDVLDGLEGVDYLDGGEGHDRLYGWDGNDELHGGSNTGDPGDDVGFGILYERLSGGAGDDKLYGEDGSDQLFGDAGNDILYGGSNTNDNAPLDFNTDDNAPLDSRKNLWKTERLYGGEGNDKLYGESGNDELHGGDGEDLLDGGTGGDRLEGGTGNDIYVVDNTNDTILDLPRTGIETVQAFISWDLRNSYNPQDLSQKTPLSGLDHLALKGNQAINGVGNHLDNTITGNDAANKLYGLDGSDKLYGNGGDDDLIGWNEDDDLSGGAGNDRLIGGFGKDTLKGGTGADRFTFNLRTEGVDVIQDFNCAEKDVIRISKSGFGASSTQQFSYNALTGALSFDASLSDAIKSVQIATLQSKPAFSAGQDIVLF